MPIRDVSKACKTDTFQLHFPVQSISRTRTGRQTVCYYHPDLSFIIRIVFRNKPLCLAFQINIIDHL